MSYDKNALRLFHNAAAAADGLTVKRFYTYVTNDLQSAVEANAYFDGALDNGLNAGDVIFAIMDDDGTPLFKAYFITAGGADVAIRGTGPAISALTFNLVSGTANNALEALANPTDSPATADALRDDLVANLLPALRNNFADLASKVEELRAAVAV
jgi:hypothetical protein